jgi:hypothetical protein
MVLTAYHLVDERGIKYFDEMRTWLKISFLPQKSEKHLLNGERKVLSKDN